MPGELHIPKTNTLKIYGMESTPEGETQTSQ